MDDIERLRRLAFNHSGRDAAGADGVDPSLDPKVVELVRLGALVAIGGCASTSYVAITDAALDAGADVAEVVDVLYAVLPVVGSARAVAAAPRLALALGHDTDDLVEAEPSPI